MSHRRTENVQSLYNINMFLYISLYSPEGPVSQNHTPHFHVAPGIFSNLLRSVQMLKIVVCGKQQKATAPIQSLVKLQSWLLSLRWKTCLQQSCNLGSGTYSEGPALGQNTLMTKFYCIIIYIYKTLHIKI